MIEVFKTNVEETADAIWLIAQITIAFPEYAVNFDLQDCDRILRIKTTGSDVDAYCVRTILDASGFECEILEDLIAAE